MGKKKEKNCLWRGLEKEKIEVREKKKLKSKEKRGGGGSRKKAQYYIWTQDFSVIWFLNNRL